MHTRTNVRTHAQISAKDSQSTKANAHSLAEEDSGYCSQVLSWEGGASDGVSHSNIDCLVVPMPKAHSKEGPTIRSIAKYQVGSERSPYLKDEDGQLRPSLCQSRTLHSQPPAAVCSCTIVCSFPFHLHGTDCDVPPSQTAKAFSQKAIPTNKSLTQGRHYWGL